MEAAVFGENPIGIIQGRLTASGGKLQCFPHGKWKEEFFVARDVGFDCIELIVEKQAGAPNPIWEPDGVEGLVEAARASGVKTLSVCDDRVMDAGLLKADGPEADAAFEAIVKLLRQISRVGATRLVLPFLEAASLKADKGGFLAVKGRLERLVAPAEESGVTLMIEDDLPIPLQRELLSSAGGKIGVCYDTGNRIWHGFDPAAEILELGPLVRHVHIKDKAADGKNVMLGTGRVDFPSVFASLKTVGYAGPLILETSRGDEEVRAGRENLAFVKSFLNQG